MTYDPQKNSKRNSNSNDERPRVSMPECLSPSEHRAPRPGIDSWDNEGGHAAAPPRTAADGNRRRKKTTSSPALLADVRSAGQSETAADELRRLTQELSAIGCRVGHLGHTSETLVLLSRTMVLMAGSVSSLVERVTQLESKAVPSPTA